MLKFIRPLLKKLAEMLEKLATPTTSVEEERVVIEEILPPKVEKKQEKSLQKKKTELIPYPCLLYTSLTVFGAAVYDNAALEVVSEQRVLRTHSQVFNEIAQSRRLPKCGRLSA